MKKVMIVPIDGTQASLKVVEFAVDVARQYGDEVQLLNIQPTLKELGLPVIKKAGELLQQYDVPYSAKIRVGIPAMEIIAESKNPTVRQIVLAVGKGKAEAIGSVSEHVVKLAECPVLLIPEHAIYH